MGTLYEQRVRWDFGINTLGDERYVEGNASAAGGVNHSVESEASDMCTLAKKMGVPLTDLIAIKHYMVLDRANDLRVRDDDAKDEQLAGFGQEIANISEAIERLASVIEDK